MNFLLDESAELRIADFLQALGHNVKSIVFDFPRSIDDEAVLQIARNEGRILITNDSDFGELIFHQRLPPSGVIYFRMKSQTIEVKLARLEKVLTEHAHELDQFIVVTEKRIRVRRNR